MNLQAEAQLLCLEIGDGSRRLNKFGNKTRANMKSHICPVHICPLAYNYRNMDCSAQLVLSLLAGPNNGLSCDKRVETSRLFICDIQPTESLSELKFKRAHVFERSFVAKRISKSSLSSTGP
jgi:hypothetical protein